MPIRLLSSTVPRAVRILAEHGYWDDSQPTPDIGGFLRFRWPVLENGAWALKEAEAHPFFSEEQYQQEFAKGARTYAEAVLLKLGRKIDYNARLAEGIQYLRNQLELRKWTVLQGWAWCHFVDCSDGSKEYFSWSTPSRDARIGNLIGQIESLVESMRTESPGLEAQWRAALEGEGIGFLWKSYPLKSLVSAWKAKAYSSNPRDPLPKRWGF
jgi:hypothetical protein